MEWRRGAAGRPIIVSAERSNLRQNGDAGSCPFNCPKYQEQGGHVTYAKGDCPVADDLFDRNIMVWLSDCYDEVDCAAIAAGMNKVFDAYCTEDPAAAKWI